MFPHDLLAAQDLERGVFRRLDGEGIRLVVVAQQGQSHPPHLSLSNCTAPGFAQRIVARRRESARFARRQATSGPQLSFRSVGPAGHSPYIDLVGGLFYTVFGCGLAWAGRT